ncbi:PPOX class probable F420-dependent enzyme [Sediminihabitans luteus]|uniref:PPOX class probable F420-dependent enzyme n=1 Tax=Sediminihabitans luteus TaxID=1138585 RepID=A0A2M9CCJ0_9CELL|nr:TIGR03618 family F420-dependent PPOX class oxidoreductase [Sediminihabitans luteus]PJJ69097.1 PPOX class probable F420-dependent enzyme [Sediminihabitans luteus]GII99483.1 PPOX class F420-dependent enzyme [Sediminihabitans luteus]
MIRLNPEQRVFVTERHLATLTTLRRDGSPHVVPVAFTWDDDAGVARVTTNRRSAKARNVATSDGPATAVLCQVDGGRWLTLEGTAEMVEDPDEVADAVRRYARRYRELSENPERVVLRIRPHKIMCSPYMRAD